MPKSVSGDVGSFLHHHPKLAVVITARSGQARNAMTVDWHTPLSHSPPLYGICIVPGRFTYQLIMDSREFGINFLPFEAVEMVHLVGSTGGRHMDKFEEFNIATDEPAKTQVPILQAAYATYECQLVDEKNYGDHTLLAGEIVAVHWMREVFTPQEVLDLNKVSPILYLGHEFYLTSARDSIQEIL